MQHVARQVGQRALHVDRRHWPRRVIGGRGGGAVGGAQLLVGADVGGGRGPSAVRQDLLHAAAGAIVAIHTGVQRIGGGILPGEQSPQRIVAQHLPGGGGATAQAAGGGTAGHVAPRVIRFYQPVNVIFDIRL